MCQLFSEGLVIDLGGRWKNAVGSVNNSKKKKLRLVFLSSSPVSRVATRRRRAMQNSVQSPVFSASQHVPAVIRRQAPAEVREM